MQRMKTIRLKWLFFFCLCSTLLLSGLTTDSIRADQLSSSLINCITQDRYGLDMGGHRLWAEPL